MAGFTIIELLVSMAVMTTCGAVTLALVMTGQSIARRQPDVSDQQQRARAAIETLGAELARAGAGLDRGARAGPLSQYFAPVGLSAEGGLTVWYASNPSAQAALVEPLAPTATYVGIDGGGTCPAAAAACGFAAGTNAILFDAAGCHDVVRIDDVTTTGVVLRPALRGCSYAAGASIAQGEVRTYRIDPASGQLLRRDEATGSSSPLLDGFGAMGVELLDAGARVRVTLRVTSPAPQPDLVVTLDASPPNEHGG